MTLRPGLHAWLAVVCAAVAAPHRARADDVKPEDAAQKLALSEVISVAVRQAPELENARIDARTSNALAKGATGAEDTKLTATVEVSKTDFGPGDLITTRLALTRLLPGGTILSLGGDVERNHRPISEANPGAFIATPTLSITQPLLRGFGLVAANPQKYVARANRTANQLREMQAACVSLSRVVEAYWDVALAWRTLAVRRSAVELAKKQLQYTEGAIKSGKIAGAEAIPVKQAIAQREQDVLNAEVEVWRLSMDLRRIAGMEIGPDVAPVATEELPEPGEVQLDQRALIQQALDNNYDLAADAAGLEGFRAAVSGAKSQRLPRVDVSATAGPRGAGDKLGKAFSSIDFDHYVVSAALDFEWNIDNDGPQAEVAVQTQNLEGAEVDARVLRLQVAGDVVTLVKIVEAAAKAAALGKQQVALAEDNVEAEQKKLEAGKSNNNEVLRRQDELQLARLRLAATLAGYQTARAKLEVQTGQILKTHGISYRAQTKTH
jgi:outer membrane protein TolC